MPGEGNGSGPLTYRQFMAWAQEHAKEEESRYREIRDEFVSRETCKARHQWLDASKLWIAIGIVGVLQVIVLAQAFAR